MLIVVWADMPFTPLQTFSILSNTMQVAFITYEPSAIVLQYYYPQFLQNFTDDNVLTPIAVVAKRSVSQNSLLYDNGFVVPNMTQYPRNQ